MTYEFYSRFARILNSGQSRSIVVTGNVYDLFWNETGYVPITDFLRDKTKPAGAIQLTYELNGPIRINGTAAEQETIKNKLTEAWVTLVSGYTGGLQQALEDSLKAGLQRKPPTKIQKYIDAFDKAWLDSIANPGVAMDFIRQLCMASRRHIKEPVHVFIENADMIVPAGKDTASLNDGQLARISVLQDLFCDPDFINGKDAVILVVESTSILNERIAKLPQVLTIDVPSPNKEQRKQYIDHFMQKHVVDAKIANYKAWEGDGDLESSTAGLSIYALRQMMLGAVYSGTPLNNASVVDKVEEYIKSQLGEDVVEFSRPTTKVW
jgi:hypothetical protein